MTQEQLTDHFTGLIREHGVRPTINAIAAALDRLAANAADAPVPYGAGDDTVDAGDLGNAAAVLRADLW